jgi:Protein-L-isoaspartate(D-aspartate) O-methyltransferase (PCMT)
MRGSGAPRRPTCSPRRPAISSFTKYTPQAGAVVFDVGAGIGAEALLFSRLVGPSGRVVSIEAHPATYDRLVKLCAVNRLENVTPLQVAVSDGEGNIVLSDDTHHLQNRLPPPDEADVRVPGAASTPSPPTWASGRSTC